ncbi:OmpA-OmpF porin, OOP family [Candidatus Magnetomoraceae bacterium gMMP-1]
MKYFLILLSFFLNPIFMSFPVMALDCEQHLGIGYELHTSKDSKSLSKDRELLNKIKNHYEQALKQCPGLCKEKPALCNNLGDVLKRLGQSDEAVHYFNKAIEYKKNFGDALFELGEIYSEKELYGISLDYYLRALDANPEDKDARLKAVAIAKEKNCAVRSAEKGEILNEDAIHDAVICTDIFNQAKKRFGLERSVIVVSLAALRNIHFDLGKAKIRPESYNQLDIVVDMLNNNKQINLIIEGHTDDLPIKRRIAVLPGVFCTDNQCLSEKRAGAIKDYFVKYGIDKNKLTTKGFGESRPFAPNDRAKNRRVELKLGP